MVLLSGLHTFELSDYISLNGHIEFEVLES